MKRTSEFYKKKISCGSLLVMLGVSLTGICGQNSTSLVSAAETSQEEIQKYANADFAMDTVVSETLYTSGEDINARIGEKLREIETEILSWTQEDSQVSILNAAQGETVEVSEELAGYLEKAIQLAKDSEGAFDPTLGKVIRLWDIDGENPHVPEESELAALLENVGYEKIEQNGNEVTLKDGCTLELGAVGKGIGCDVIADFLKEQTDVTGMILNLGGSSVMTYGEKPDGTDWKIALTDPRDPEGDYLGTISLEAGQFLSTSGDYEKYFMENGKRYHHILDPKTGYPVWNGLTSVTVVCEDGFLADGLSTACFVLGREKVEALLEKYKAEAVFVDEDKNVYATDGIKEQFELMKDTYTMK